MEDNNNKVSAEYLKAYNQAYILNQYQPEVTVTFERGLGQSERSKGFKDAMNDWKENRDDMLKSKADKDKWEVNKKDILGDKPENKPEPKNPYMPKWLQPGRVSDLNRMEPDMDMDHDKDFD